MNSSINRQLYRGNSRMDKMRREVSRQNWHEDPVNPEKEMRSILMGAWPKKRKCEEKRDGKNRNL